MIDEYEVRLKEQDKVAKAISAFLLLTMKCLCRYSHYNVVTVVKASAIDEA